MKIKKSSTSGKYSRPARATRGSIYDAIFDAAVDLEVGSAVTVSFDSAAEAKKALNGARGRRTNRGLGSEVDLYIAADGHTLVATPFVPSEEDED